MDDVSLALGEKVPRAVDGYNKTADEIENLLQTDYRTGISSQEAETRRELYGQNVVYSKKPSIIEVYIAPLLDTLIVIYLIMTALLFLFSLAVPETRGQVWFWLTFIAFNMVLAIFQQYRAQKKVEALKNLSPPKAKVIRDGLNVEILAENLVVGDVIELALGDKIPADCRLIESSNLTVNEASLTGESIAVRKAEDTSGALDLDTPISARRNMLYFGTFVQTGSAKAVVTAIGNQTELGRIAAAMGEMHTLEIPLRTRVNAIGKWLGFFMVFFLFLLLGYRLTTIPINSVKDFAKVVTSSMITAMAVMPINIPLLTTVVLITGVLHMAQKNVIVKELAVVETLGRTSVLCSDKTGTMTTSKMTVVKIWDGGRYYEVPNQRHKPIYIGDEEGEEKEVFKKVDIDSTLGFIIASGVLNNDATLVETSENVNEINILGNATDIALMNLARRSNINIFDLNQRFVSVKKYPFDSAVKRMSAIFEDRQNEGRLIVFTKGASEVILERCTKVHSLTQSSTMKESTRKDIMKKIDTFANEGYRLVSLAYKEIDKIPESDDLEQERAEIESGLTYLGFMCILDPPRPGVEDAVATLDNAGIFPIMITGDAPTTAGTIARKVGILDPDELVVEGKDIPNLTDEEFFKVSVFARVSPQDKQIIVERYQDAGGVVAMTGDGVNDALAITMADAGVAMGITGTEVAKEAADIVIADDSYVSLVKGVAEGRNLYERIRIMIFFYIALNIAEAIMYFLAAFFLNYILNDLQRAYIFMIVHALPPLAIIFGKEDENIMELEPREQDALIPKNMLRGMIIFIIVFATSMLTVFTLTFNRVIPINELNSLGVTEKFDGDYTTPAALHLAHAKARTMLLTVVYVVETMIVFSIRRINKNFIEGVKDSDKFIFLIVGLPLFIHLLMMYTPLNFGINLIMLSLGDWIIALIFAALPLAALEIFKQYKFREGEQF